MKIVKRGGGGATVIPGATFIPESRVMKSFWFKYPNVIYELEKEPSLILQNLSISESGQMGSFAAQSRLVCICSSSWLLAVKSWGGYLKLKRRRSLLPKLSKNQV